MIARFKKAVKNYFRPEVADHSEFLPRGLSARETLPHHAPHIFLYILMTMILSVFLWAILGKTEVVAVSQGMIISSDKIRTIQVFDRSVVKEIYVRDGDKVVKDQILLELDSGLAKADLERISEKRATILGLKSEENILIEQARIPATEEAQEARRNIASLLEQKKKAEIILKTTLLKAPIEGIVQQLAVNTVGGVVTPAQSLMVIVPKDATLEAEVTFQNKDIGFVEVGQKTHVKIDSFPYTKYGMLDGEVTVISGDAIEDEKQGLVYKGRVKLYSNTIRVGNKDVPLQAGMRLTAEVKTGERRLIEYFLSPIMVHTDQASRER